MYVHNYKFRGIYNTPNLIKGTVRKENEKKHVETKTDHTEVRPPPMGNFAFDLLPSRDTETLVVT